MIIQGTKIANTQISANDYVTSGLLLNLDARVGWNGSQWQDPIHNIPFTQFNGPTKFDNYFHFVYDTLPYLISFFELKKEIPNLKLLMNYPNFQKNKFYTFVNEFLEILNIMSTDIKISINIKRHIAAIIF